MAGCAHVVVARPAAPHAHPFGKGGRIVRVARITVELGVVCGEWRAAEPFRGALLCLLTAAGVLDQPLGDGCFTHRAVSVWCVCVTTAVCTRWLSAQKRLVCCVLSVW